MRCLLLVCALLLPVSASAQGWIEPIPLPRPGSQPQRVEKLRTSVTVRVTGRVARVEVEEWFRNTGGGLAEGDYIYPLAGEAVFSDFSLFQGEEELKGEPMDAKRARAIYEEIVRRHRDPALIEMAGHGLLRARVFPFGPGETRNVRLQFSQVLERAGDALRFRYVAGSARAGTPASTPVPPRPMPLTRDSQGRVPPPAHDEVPLTFTLVSDEAGRFGEPFSPTHLLRVSRDRDRLTVRPRDALTGSFDVFLPLAGPQVGIALAAHRVDGEDGYFMLTLTPGAVQADPEPRDVAVVVDVSGSMSGEKLEQARDALHQLIGTLNARDRFRLVAFGNRVEAQSRDWVPATRAGLDEARAWVDRLAASGGTNIAGALEEAFRIPAGAERLHLVIVITDGQPTVGETNPDRIAAHVEAGRRDARIFAFGVGFDLNTYLLERMAAAGQGTVDYVQPGAHVEEAVGALANRIQHPILTNLSFGNTPVPIADLQPARLPDLYAGQELVVFGRYDPRRVAAGELTITGTRAGRIERFSASVDLPAHVSTGGYIPSLWASRKVGELMRTIRVEGETPARVAEVRSLALRYGLVTEYTSYLVQEPTPRGALAVDGVAGGGGGGGARGGFGGRGGGPGQADAAPATPSTTAVSGEDAVRAAGAASARRQADSVADVARAEQALAQDLRARLEASSGTQLVAGRTFRLDAGAWIDAGHATQATVVELEPYSKAYFDVLAKLPELTPYWSAFDAVTVAGRDVSIRLAPNGRSTLAVAEIDALVQQFRARP